MARALARHVLTTLATVAVAVGCMAVAPALAFTGNSGGAAKGAQTGPKVCNQGFVYSSEKKACVTFAGQIPVACRAGTVYDLDTRRCVQLQAGLHDPQLYQQGLALALAGNYQDAIDVLQTIEDRDSSVLTMLGYATRKLGHLDEGIAIYHQALAIDPTNVNTREYLGEGYLAAGRVDLAEAELDTIEAICGVDCLQYQTLAKVLAGDGLWQSH